jgi:hypothetical protein
MYPTAAVPTREHRMTVPVANRAGLCLFDKVQDIFLRHQCGVG